MLYEVITIVDLTLHQYLNTDLHNTPKIFAWHHPIGGMGFGSERYFGNGTPLLLTLEISPDARIFAIDNVGDGIARTWGELKNADLIFHGNESLSEWIIINPNVVKNYSALPTNFSKSTLQHYYKLLNNPSVKDVESLQLISLYSERSFLYESHGDARKALKQFMGLAKDDLPSLFSRITSYNVCYTKLLRLFLFPRRREGGRSWQKGEGRSIIV